MSGAFQKKSGLSRARQRWFMRIFSMKRAPVSLLRFSPLMLTLPVSASSVGSGIVFRMNRRHRVSNTDSLVDWAIAIQI